MSATRRSVAGDGGDEPVPDDPWAAAVNRGSDYAEPPAEAADDDYQSLHGRRTWRRGGPGEPHRAMADPLDAGDLRGDRASNESATHSTHNSEPGETWKPWHPSHGGEGWQQYGGEWTWNGPAEQKDPWWWQHHREETRRTSSTSAPPADGVADQSAGEWKWHGPTTSRRTSTSTWEDFYHYTSDRGHHGGREGDSRATPATTTSPNVEDNSGHYYKNQDPSGRTGGWTRETPTNDEDIWYRGQKQWDGFYGTSEKRGAISEKMNVPVFSAEDTGEKLGQSARSYLRQIDTWSQLTRTPPKQQALLLYQHLQGRAWLEAEEIPIASLATDDGVERFKGWIAERYQEIEIGKIGEALNGFFKRLKRGPSQSIREFNGTFDRAYARLLEVDCRLPETARAWAYLNALGLTHAEELTILGSVSNEYVTSKLQKAAVLHEKSLRRAWDRDKPKPWSRTPNSALNASSLEDDFLQENDAPDSPFDAEDDEAASVYEAYMTAKMQYKETLKARGLDQEGVRRATEDRIAHAKAKSFCSVCKQRGHWHRDAECPANKRKEEQKGALQTAHAIFETASNLGEQLLAITDCACSKSVMGTTWLQKYIDMMKRLSIEVPLLPEQDNFRFGASRIYNASYAVVVPILFESTWVLVRAAVVQGDLPLLISRSALASLGMIYNMEEHVADFTSVGVRSLALYTTPSGHPALSVLPGHDGVPPHARPQMWDASKSIRGDVQILNVREGYMVGSAAGFSGLSLGTPSRTPQFFYEKKIPPPPRIVSDDGAAGHRAKSFSESVPATRTAWPMMRSTPVSGLFVPLTMLSTGERPSEAPPRSPTTK